VAHPALREIVQALKRLPDVAAAGLLPELSGEPARHALSALLVEEHVADDPRASIEQYTRRLDRAQRLRRMRVMGRTIAEAQQTTGVAAPVDDHLRALHEDGAGVYGFGGGTAQSLEHGPQGPQGVHTHE
jgi:hypothetical protein